MLQLLCAVAVAWAASTPADIRNPALSGKWVSDGAGVISGPTERELNAILEQMQLTHEVEVAVVTVRAIEGTPKRFTTDLFNLWGVGDGETHRGLLVVLVLEQRRLEMETGYGLEADLPDGWLGVMQSRSMVPEFRREDYAGGLLAGMKEVERRLAEGAHFDGAQPVSDDVGPLERVRRNPKLLLTEGVLIPLFLFIAIFIYVLGHKLRGWKRHRREALCPACKVDTLLLDETAEDEHLDTGQQAEEATGRLEWDVRLCPQCRHVRVIDKTDSYNRRSHVNPRCVSCRYRTGKIETTVIEPATYTSTGRGRVTRTCSHCDYRKQGTYTIHKKVPPTSSGSSYSSSSDHFSSGGGGFSSGGSFGGGSSGGGGAGSSW